MNHLPDLVTDTDLAQADQIEKAADSGFLFCPEIMAAQLARTLLNDIFKEGVGGEADLRYRRGLQDVIAGVSSSPTKKEDMSNLNKARRVSRDATFYAFIERLTYVANSLTDY